MVQVRDMGPLAQHASRLNASLKWHNRGRTPDSGPTSTAGRGTGNGGWLPNVKVNRPTSWAVFRWKQILCLRDSPVLRSGRFFIQNPCPIRPILLLKTTSPPTDLEGNRRRG